MADNIQVRDGNSVLQTMKTKDNAGVHTPAHYLVDINGNPLTAQNVDRNTDLDQAIAIVTNAMLFGRVSDTSVRNARLDAMTHAFLTLDYEHHEIHSGDHYFISELYPGLSNGQLTDHVITTPALPKTIHMTVQAFGTGELNLKIYEGATGVTGGTPETPQNNNRNMANASTITLVENPTTVTPGTNLIYHQQMDPANASTPFIGMARHNELVLKASTIYLFRLTSLANGNDLNLNFNWYEHTDRT